MTPNTDKVLYFWIISIWHTSHGQESPQWFFFPYFSSEQLGLFHGLSFIVKVTEVILFGSSEKSHLKPLRLRHFMFYNTVMITIGIIFCTLYWSNYTPRGIYTLIHVSSLYIWWLYCHRCTYCVGRAMRHVTGM